MVLAQHCLQRMPRLVLQGREYNLTPAVDWLDSLIGLGELLLLEYLGWFVKKVPNNNNNNNIFCHLLSAIKIIMFYNYALYKILKVVCF
jgi:hypothetical protein